MTIRLNWARVPKAIPTHCPTSLTDCNHAYKPRWCGHLQSQVRCRRPRRRQATGACSVPLADFLVGAGYAASVVNLAKIHAFAKTGLSQ